MICQDCFEKVEVARKVRNPYIAIANMTALSSYEKILESMQELKASADIDTATVVCSPG